MSFILRTTFAASCLSTLACSAVNQPGTEQMQTGSALTAVNVSLPAASQLPDSLKEKDLYYCFAIDDVNSMPVYAPTEANTVSFDNQLPCAGNRQSFGWSYAVTFSSEGDYQESIKLEKSLDSSKSYFVRLAVGIKVDADQAQPVTSGPYSQTQTIDSQSIHYIGTSYAYTADMNGKSKLSLELDMKKQGEGDGEPVITTGTKVDLDVRPVFQDENTADSSSEDDSKDDSSSEGDDQDSKLDSVATPI